MNQPPSTNPNPSPSPSPSPYNNARLTAPSSGECGNCGSQKRWVLHHVRIRGIHRRLCTSCVLRLHPSSFCPTCFQFYDSNNNVPPSSKRLTCSKCSSFTHSHCAPTPQPPSSSASAYLCPPCASPSFVFFDIDSDPNRAIDKRLALILLCAAKISAASMSKAVILARGEAERRVREAALARKRAREALDNLAVLVSGRGDKAVRRDAAEVSGLGNVGSRQKEKSPLGRQNSQGKMFNGFPGHPRQSSMVSPLGKNDNGNGEHKPVIDHHHHRRPGLQSNGSLYEKDKSGAMDEKVKLEPKI